MNRADRLYAVREELRRAGSAGRTAERLAEVFEVSVRTIKRDISALQQGGFPVAARPGPGGGYVVDAAATLPPVNFTDSEVSGLTAAVAAHRGQPFEAYARAALVKALGVMDGPARDRATALAERIWIDHTDALPDSQVRRVVERALLHRLVIVVRYSDAPTTRPRATSTPCCWPALAATGTSLVIAAPGTRFAGFDLTALQVHSSRTSRHAAYLLSRSAPHPPPPRRLRFANAPGLPRSACYNEIHE